MAITRTAMIDDDGSGTTGTILNNAWKQEFYNQIDALAGNDGLWVDVPFALTNFVASDGATWNLGVPNISVQRYMIIGQTMRYHLSVAATEVLGSPGILSVVLPPGYSVGANFVSPILFNDAATGNIVGYAYGNPPDSVINFKKLSGSPWTPTTTGNGTDLFITLEFEIRP